MEFVAQVWEALVQIWTAFVQFIQGVSPEAIGVVRWFALAVILISLIVYIIVRKSTRVTLALIVTPLVIWTLSWLWLWLSSITGGGASETLSWLYRFFVLVSLVWGVIILVRVPATRRG